MLWYHHCRSLEGVSYGHVDPRPEHAEEFHRGAYSWLEQEVGFYPLFLAVGITDEGLRMTGYQDQWMRILSEGPNGKEYRKKGDVPNDVLFSFDTVDGVYMDYLHWHLVLNSEHNGYCVTDYEKKLVFKPSWTKSKWLRKARNDPNTVQLVTPDVHLPSANRIWVRNKKTRCRLLSMGFENVDVKRLSVKL